MSVEELESSVARLSSEELTRFSRWFAEFTADEDRVERPKAVDDVRAFRAKMQQKYGIQESNVNMVRETCNTSDVDAMPDAHELARRRQLVHEMDELRAQIRQRSGVHPDSTPMIREMRGNE